MTSYILNCLTREKWIVFSWGFNSPVAINNGLQFNVNGFIFKGIVQVIYNEGTDLFDLNFIKNNVALIPIPNVSIVELIEVLDDQIERVDNYNERVKKENPIIKLLNIKYIINKSACSIKVASYKQTFII